mgnify:CR=1 FL=1
MKLKLIIIAILGLALGVYLITYVGLNAVIAAISAVGWSGFALLAVYGLLMYLMLGACWHVLVPDMPISRMSVFLWGRMVRDAASEVLPFSQVGGFVIGTRAAVLKGLSLSMAAASTIVDVTTEMLAQVIYLALGIALLSSYAPKDSLSASLMLALVAGLTVASVGGLSFLLLQRNGVWVREKVA